MRVAVVGTNDPHNVSGGRYHALMLAHAVASLGWDAHFITDNKPSFFEDLGPLAPGRVQLHLTRDFASRLPKQSFDWVIVVPTGIFLPEFYEACLEFARAGGARLGLVNFESATWFNAMAPEPRDPRLWDYWRRICVEGALVLSSARESNDWARRFYAAAEGRIRFEVWQPPINSVAARRFDELEKDGSLVAFVRPQDTHKGSGFLTALNPRLLSRRTLHLISGREAPASFRNAIARHLAQAENADVAFHLRINDQHKFRLIAAAQAVLFPSRFEGYGYPPVEAAYSGTESVAFDLPVLRETVGAVAHLAPTPDIAGFESAMQAALARPERRAELRQAVFEIADFPHCALRLADILLRSADAIAPLPTRGFRALVGPFARAAPAAPATVDRHAPTPPFPPFVTSAVETTGGDLLATLRAFAPAGTTFKATLLPAGAPLALAAQLVGKPSGVLQEMRFYVLAPKAALGQRIAITALGQDSSALAEFRLERVRAREAERPALAGVSEDRVGPDGRRLRVWTLAREPLSEIVFSPEGRNWLTLPVDRERRDIAGKYPIYGVARCELQTDLPANLDIDRHRALFLCLAASGRSPQAVDALVGWPPAAKSYYADEAKAEAARPAEPAPVTPASAGKTKPRRPQLGEIALAPLNSGRWRNGVARDGAAGRMGAVAVPKDAPAAILKPGAVLRFASGAARRIVAVAAQDAFLVLTLDGPLHPEAAGPPPAKATVHEGDWALVAERQFVLFPWTDDRWWRGVWNLPGPRFRRGLTIKIQEARTLQMKIGTTLRFAVSGFRKISEIDENGGNMRIWLDGAIRPLADMDPHPIVVVAGAEEDGPAFARIANERNAICVPGEDARQIRPGDLVRFAIGTLARVIGVDAEAEQVRLTLDRPLTEPEAQGRLSLVDEADTPGGYTTPYRLQGFDLPARDPLFRTLAREAINRGSALRPDRPAPMTQRRALIVSSVAPCPANQGNRLVTRNLIRHLIDLGFQCDVVVQNSVDASAAIDEFGAGARFFPVAYPRWQASQAHMLRKSILEISQQMRTRPLDAHFADAVDLAASQYHPGFIVRDETVDLARALYAQHRYDAVVVNYTHMIRVAEDLQDIRPLPPTAVFTHDALSRLPRAFGANKLDLGHRLCDAETERDALNAIPSACIVAISRSEAEYFRAIGVRNRVVLTEYDAVDEMAPFAAAPDAFERRTLIFHGSANPMNVAGLDWFVDECWAQILAAAPGARLVVCGAVGAAWNPKLPGVEVVGEQPRDRMLALCGQSSVAINPCVAGTGLKIKTVETAALGLPAVCLPSAVEGLEDIANSFAIVTADAQGFAGGCIALLTDRERWSGLRESALAAASQRFAAETVYRELDDAMGLRAERGMGAGEPDGFDEDLAEVANPLAVLEQEPDNEAAQFALGKSLTRGGRADAGWPMVDQIASARRGDWRVAMEATELGLQAGEPWRAAVHAGRMIAQRPSQLRGYLAMGRALVACGLAEDAVAAFEQGLMTAPFDEQAQRGLIDALMRAKRLEEAEKWRVRRAFSPSLGQYFALGFDLPGVRLRGFEAGELPGLRAGEGELLLPEPHGDARRISATLDVTRPEGLSGDVELELSLETARQNCRLRARGPGVQTLRITADARLFQSGSARLALRIVAQEPLPAPLRLVGLLVEADASAERRRAGRETRGEAHELERLA